MNKNSALTSAASRKKLTNLTNKPTSTLLNIINLGTMA